MRVASYISTSEQMTDDFPYIDRSLLPTIAFKLDAARVEEDTISPYRISNFSTK